MGLLGSQRAVQFCICASWRQHLQATAFPPPRSVLRLAATLVGGSCEPACAEEAQEHPGAGSLCLSGGMAVLVLARPGQVPLHRPGRPPPPPGDAASVFC